MNAHPAATARYVGAFFDELYRLGVRDVVVSPGSRSTPLAMIAFEMSQHPAYDLRLFLDIDERGAAFFALGRAKATHRPACVLCTSGTAGANYYPAVLEAESSRVPLLVLTGDRPPRLQGLGAPQTCDQLKLFGDHVRSFRQMPLPVDDEHEPFARQAAREAYVHAQGAHAAYVGGPVHINFPFEEPLKPDVTTPGLFDSARRGEDDRIQPACKPLVAARDVLAPDDATRLLALMREHRVAIFAGEGAEHVAPDARDQRHEHAHGECHERDGAEALLTFATRCGIPVLADPLSNMRAYDHSNIIAAYDAICKGGDAPAFDLIVRIGRYPISKSVTQQIERQAPVQIVVDPLETRDFNARTDVFVQATPQAFFEGLLSAAETTYDISPHQAAYLATWQAADAKARTRADELIASGQAIEGACVRSIVKRLDHNALLFAANSMAVRWVDAFAHKASCRMLCNRGLNGIDGTLSTALGAAQDYEHVVFLTGDLTLLHDLSAFALQREMLVAQRAAGHALPHVVVVVLNNQGGGIFDMLPQKSEDAYFERLFLTPQQVDLGQVAAAFNVPYAQVDHPLALDEQLDRFLDVEGISLIDVTVPRSGVRDRLVVS